MPQPLRKIFQKNLLRGGEARAQESGRAPIREGREGRNGREVRQRRTLDLSGAAACALGLALVAAVGWAFFMGYLVGRGEHPGRGVESVAGLLRPAAPAQTGDAASTPGRPPLPAEEAIAGQAPDGAAAPPAAGAEAAEAAPEANLPAAEAALAPATATTPAESGPGAYPFNRPQGEGLAAWGITSEAPQAARAAQAQAAAKPAAGAAPAQARKAPPVPAEPRFDYLFQAAAFKGPVDAERLRARLTAAGMRAIVRQSGKVRLVLVALRGTAQEAQKLAGQLAAMGLGRPIQLEKTPVAEKTGGKRRPRSAP